MKAALDFTLRLTLCLLVLVLVAAREAPTSSEAQDGAASLVSPGLRGTPARLGDDAERASRESFGLWVAPTPGPRGPALDAGSEEARKSSPAEFDLATGGEKLAGVPQAIAPTRSGTWAYASSSYGPRYLAIPEGPGYLIEVCGPAACFERVSTDAGPVLSLQRQGRIGDLSSIDFERACGVPISYGLCPGSYTILRRPGATLPPTSVEEGR